MACLTLAQKPDMCVFTCSHACLPSLSVCLSINVSVSMSQLESRLLGEISITSDMQTCK